MTKRPVMMIMTAVAMLAVPDIFAAEKVFEQRVKDLEQSGVATKIVNIDAENGDAAKGYSFYPKKFAEKCLSIDAAKGCQSKASIKLVRSPVNCVLILSAIMVKSGEMYILELNCMKKGESAPVLALRWLANSGYVDELDFKASITGKNGAWLYKAVIFEVPDNVQRLHIMLAAGEQPDPEDICWFDNISVYKLQ